MKDSYEKSCQQILVAKFLQVLTYLNCRIILRDLDRFLLEPYKKILQVLGKFLLMYSSYGLERS